MASKDHFKDIYHTYGLILFGDFLKVEETLGNKNETIFGCYSKNRFSKGPARFRDGELRPRLPFLPAVLTLGQVNKLSNPRFPQWTWDSSLIHRVLRGEAPRRYLSHSESQKC